MRYNSKDIDILIDTLKIEEVVGEFVELKKAGANYKGLCPFHADTTPSFMVSPEKNICKCFVCGAGGNPISFYSQYKKISFMEAVQELAKKYSIPIAIDKRSTSEEKNNRKYYEIMAKAHQYFTEMIFENQGREALEYLGGRQITPKIIKENGLGYAPKSWSGLYDRLITQGYKAKELLELGLIKIKDDNYYDSFRNRIMFPIYSAQGEIIAFGGRTLENDKNTPKYINSPDTPIFKKGRNLYGIEKGNIIRKKNYAFLMEGYMDVLSAYIYGFDVALAPLGTALTEEQGELLKRYTNNIILAFDQDNPGQNATERAALILKKIGFNIRVLKLEGAKDPDEFLKSFGKEKFLKFVKNSVEVFDFLYEFYSSEYDLSNTMSKQNFINRFKEFFLSVDSELEKTLYLDRLSKELDIERDVLKDILVDKNLKKTRKFLDDRVSIEIDNKKIITRVEKDTLQVMLLSKDNIKYFMDKNIQGSLTIKIFEYIEDYGIENINKIDEYVEFTDEELVEWKLIICSVLENISNYKKIEELQKETFISWFKQEIEDMYKVAKKMDLLTGVVLINKIKNIEIELSKINVFSDILELYRNFKEIINL